MKLTKTEARQILHTFYGTNNFCPVALEAAAVKELGYQAARELIRQICQKVGEV